MTDAKTIPVRLPTELHKEFSKKLIDDGISAQEFFIRHVRKYVSGCRCENFKIKRHNPENNTWAWYTEESCPNCVNPKERRDGNV